MWNFLGGGATVIPGAMSIPESRVLGFRNMQEKLEKESFDWG